MIYAFQIDKHFTFSLIPIQKKESNNKIPIKVAFPISNCHFGTYLRFDVNPIYDFFLFRDVLIMTTEIYIKTIPKKVYHFYFKLFSGCFSISDNWELIICRYKLNSKTVFSKLILSLIQF